MLTPGGVVSFCVLALTRLHQPMKSRSLQEIRSSVSSSSKASTSITSRRTVINLFRTVVNLRPRRRSTADRWQVTGRLCYNLYDPMISISALLGPCLYLFCCVLNTRQATLLADEENISKKGFLLLAACVYMPMCCLTVRNGATYFSFYLMVQLKNDRHCMTVTLLWFL